MPLYHFTDSTRLPWISRRGEVTEFDPERHRLTVAAPDYGIEEARRLRDWPALEEAVDLKIEEQRRAATPGGSTNDRTSNLR